MAETNTPTPETSRVVADLASFGEVIGQLAEDKSNDWTAEISTLSDVEKELEQARRDLELYQRHFGPVERAEEAGKFADLGEYTAALYGSNSEWDIAFPESIAEYWKEALHGEHSLGDQDEAALAHWRVIADRLGIEHDADDEEDDEDDEDTCDAEGCDESLSDGEGYDGYCGTHADERENDGVYDGAEVPA